MTKPTHNLVARTAAAIILTACLGLLASACGSSGGSHVAQLNATATQTTTSSTGSSGSSTAGGSTRAEALTYSQCMRSHGIGDFPDPNANGGFMIDNSGANSDLNRNNPTFQAAAQACRRYNPQQDITPARQVQLTRQYLSFARCMRSHGVSDFPDPVIGAGGHPGFALQGGPNSDLSATNPAFQTGVETCQHILGHTFKFAFLPNGRGKGA